LDGKTTGLSVVLMLNELRPGGLEKVVVDLAAGLAGKGNRVHVVCLQGEGLLASGLRALGVPVKAFHSFRSFDTGAVFRLARFIRRLRPDVIHVHELNTVPYAVSAAFLLPHRVPVLFTAHSLLFQGVGSHPKALGLFFRRLAAVSAVSHAVGERHRAELGWGGPIAVIPNGIEPVSASTEAGARIRSQLACTKEMFVFLAAGNVRPEKGFEDLLFASSLLRQKTGGDRFRVWVAGGASDQACFSNLSARIREERLEKVFLLLGYRDDVPDLYGAADAFVLSSRSEGLPLVVLEAMSAGLPIIATKVGGVPETVGSCGILCDPGNAEGLAEAMHAAFADRDALTAKALSGKERIVKLYSRDRMVEDYLRAYEEISR